MEDVDIDEVEIARVQADLESVPSFRPFTHLVALLRFHGRDQDVMEPEQAAADGEVAFLPFVRI